jgi:hypothetical protein
VGPAGPATYVSSSGTMATFQFTWGPVQPNAAFGTTNEVDVTIEVSDGQLKASKTFTNVMQLNYCVVLR